MKFSSTFLPIFLNLSISSGITSGNVLFSKKSTNVQWSEPEEVIKCLKYITNLSVGRSSLILLREEIREIPWINVLLQRIEIPRIIIGFDEEYAADSLGLYLLFRGYAPTSALQYWERNLKMSRILIVWRGTVSPDKVLTVFNKMWADRITNVFGVAKLTNDYDIKVYSYSPYSRAKCGSVELVLVDEWNATTGTLMHNSNFFESTSLNFQGCVLKVICNHKPPDSIVKYSPKTHKLEISGVSQKLLEIAEKYFNFSSSVRSVNLGTWLNHSWYYATEELDFICDAVSQEKVDFAFGWFSYSTIDTNDLNLRAELGGVTSIDCFGWVVPLRAGVRPSNSTYYKNEFEDYTWILILVTICVTSWALYFILRRNLLTAALIVIQIFLEQPIVNQPSRKRTFRILFSNLCFYSLVVSAAYKASFASFITVSLHGKDFSSVAEILESPLEIYGSPNMFRILNATAVETKTISAVLKRFKVLPVGEFEENMKRLIRQRDMAIIGVKRTLYYYSLSEAKRLNIKIPFRFIPGCLIRPHTTHFLFKRGSFLIRPFNKLLNRLFETGIVPYWILHLGSNRILPTERLRGRNIRVQFLRTPFRILLFGYVVSYLVFVLEFVCHRIVHE